MTNQFFNFFILVVFYQSLYNSVYILILKPFYIQTLSILTFSLHHKSHIFILKIKTSTNKLALTIRIPGKSYLKFASQLQKTSQLMNIYNCYIGYFSKRREQLLLLFYCIPIFFYEFVNTLVCCTINVIRKSHYSSSTHMLVQP